MMHCKVHVCCREPGQTLSVVFVPTLCLGSSSYRRSALCTCYSVVYYRTICMHALKVSDGCLHDCISSSTCQTQAAKPTGLCAWRAGEFRRHLGCWGSCHADHACGNLWHGTSFHLPRRPAQATNCDKHEQNSCEVLHGSNLHLLFVKIGTAMKKRKAGASGLR